ncbi:MAG: ATP-binding protein [Thermodesulfobacteriota bacterium]
MDSLRLPARLESMEAVRSFIKEKIRGWNLDARLANRVELALEEALVNISRYAYPHYQGEVEVRCSLGDTGRLYLEIHDWGIPFNPLERLRPDPAQDLSSRRVGGWGVALMRHMADDLQYLFAQGKNILYLSFLPRETDLPEPGKLESSDHKGGRP